MTQVLTLAHFNPGSFSPLLCFPLLLFALFSIPITNVIHAARAVLHYVARHYVWVRSTKLELLKRAYVRVGHGRHEEGVGRHHARQLTRIAVMLLRYEALVSAKIACGMQGAIPPAAAEALSEHFGACHECFASPLNHHYASFYSAFPDTDRWFGSRGSFFESFPRQGSFQCNPPFAGLSAQQIGNHISRLLASSDLPLSFTVFVPKKVYEDFFKPDAKGKGAGAEAVDMSRWQRHAYKLPYKAHWYVSGNHHILGVKDRDACWDSTIDTYVLWWQNDAGNYRWPVTEASKEALKNAFQVKPVGLVETAGGAGAVAERAAAAEACLAEIAAAAAAAGATHVGTGPHDHRHSHSLSRSGAWAGVAGGAAGGGENAGQARHPEGGRKRQRSEGDGDGEEWERREEGATRRCVVDVAPHPAAPRHSAAPSRVQQHQQHPPPTRHGWCSFDDMPRGRGARLTPEGDKRVAHGGNGREDRNGDRMNRWEWKEEPRRYMSDTAPGRASLPDRGREGDRDRTRGNDRGRGNGGNVQHGREPERDRVASKSEREREAWLRACSSGGGRGGVRRARSRTRSPPSREAAGYEEGGGRSSRRVSPQNNCGYDRRIERERRVHSSWRVHSSAANDTLGKLAAMEAKAAATAAKAVSDSDDDGDDDGPPGFPRPVAPTDEATPPIDPRRLPLTRRDT